MTRPVLTVRGGGIFGLSIAFEAAMRGAKVRLIETEKIGAGASGGIIGAMCPHIPEAWNPKKAFQLDSLLMAENWWAGVAAASNLQPGYARLGRLQPLVDQTAVDLAHARSKTAAQLWGDAAKWQVVRAAAVGDWAPSSPSGFLIQDTLSARVNPRLGAAALTQAITALGGEIILGQMPDTAPNTGPVIWATGVAGLDALSGQLGKPIGQGVKGQSLLLRYSARDLPQVFVGGLHIVPHANGTVAIGSTSENTWDHPTQIDAQCDDLHARAVAAMPVLAGAAVLERWAGLRPRANSRAPILGAWPNRAGHFIANGGFKIGFGMAPKVAQTMVDLVLDGRDTIPDGFRIWAG